MPRWLVEWAQTLFIRNWWLLNKAKRRKQVLRVINYSNTPKPDWGFWYGRRRGKQGCEEKEKEKKAQEEEE